MSLPPNGWDIQRIVEADERMRAVSERAQIT
jgi:hypothetical protein